MPKIKNHKKLPQSKKTKSPTPKKVNKSKHSAKAALISKTPKKKTPTKKLSPKPKKQIRKKSRFLNTAYVFMALGIIFIIVPVIFYFNQTIQLSLFNPKVSSVAHTTNNTPVAISIPAVNVDLKVKPTVISNYIWQIAPDGASYLSTSSRPGEKGAIILYGHNTPERFGPISALKPGETIILKTSDNKFHIYKISKTLTVYPDKMDVFNQKDETLVMYTCTGFADLKRFVVIAHPAS